VDKWLVAIDKFFEKKLPKKIIQGEASSYKLWALNFCRSF
tara:strand:+ start:495 stop:614 length:120 start_codon:yes stop_codon:yes gene_type:complete